MVYAVNGLPALHRAGGVHFGAQCAGFAHQAKSEFKRMHAHAFGLPHGGVRVALVAVVGAQFFGAQHACAVAKDVAAYPRLFLQVGYLGCAVRHIQMPAVKSVAIDLLGERFEVIKASADFGVQLFGRL